MINISEILEKSSPKDFFEEIHKLGEDNISFEELIKLKKHIIKIDQRGKWCVLFAEKFSDKIDITDLEDAVIEKDKTGQFCYSFAKFVKGSDKEKLRKAVEEKDKTGVWKLKFQELFK